MDSSNDKEGESEYKEVLKQDTVRLLFKPTTVLPIGWGFKYKCKLIAPPASKVSPVDSIFTLSLAVGRQDLIELEKGETYSITLVTEGEKSEKTYLPSGTSGLVDSRRIIWMITEIEKIKSQQ